MKMVEVRVQTMYREMEIQTDPWSPPYIQKSDELPEVLLLTNLIWGNGLPAGKHEVEEIIRNRKKRAWDMYMASQQQSISVGFKRKIITQIEQDDWEFLSQDLENINEQRMELAQKRLDEQRNDFTAKLQKKVDKMNSSIVERYNEQVKKIHLDKAKELRRLNTLMKKRFVEKYEKRTIIDNFSDRQTDMYGFRARLGYHRKNVSIVLCPDAYTMVKENKIRHRKFNPPERASKTKKHNCLKEQFISATEEELDQYFKMLESRHEEENVTKQTEKKENDSTKQRELLKFSKIVDQKEASEPSQEIGEETNGAHDDPEAIELRRQRVLENYRQSCLESYDKDNLFLHAGGLENSLLGRLVDLTSKEKLRLDEEKKLLAMALKAQAERWRREAREAGKRQKKQMREAIKKKILDQALEEIGQDLQNQFENTLKESILDMAILEAEDEMRVNLFDIDRDEIPKSDEGVKLEEMIHRLRGEPRSKLIFKQQDGSLTDLGEIMNAVNELYEEIISIAIELDDLVSSLNDAEVKESKFRLIKEKFNYLFCNQDILPGLEGLKTDVIDAYSKFTNKQERIAETKRMDILCDSVIDIANELYDTVIGDSDIDEILHKIDRYNDEIVDDAFIKHLDKKYTRYIFKMIKISHVLGHINPGSFAIDINDRIKIKAKNICTTVSKIAVKVDDLLFTEEVEAVSETEEIYELVPEMESEKEDSFIERAKRTKMERLCNKLLDKKKKKKEKMSQTSAIEILVEAPSKIDVCKIKEEAAEIVEMIIEIWLAIEEMLDKIDTANNIAELHESMMNSLKCAIDKLEQQFGNIEGFPGFRTLLCNVQPLECTDEKLLSEFRKNIPKIAIFQAQRIIDSIMRNSLKLCNLRQIAPLNFTSVKKLFYMREPYKSDLVEMAKDPDMYPTVQLLIDPSNNSL